MRVARAVRPVLVLALATTGLATPAIAKTAPKPPKPVCHIVTDLEGDAHRRPVSNAPVAVFDSPALDITSADIATGKKTVAVVLRVKTTDATNDPYAPLGFSWTFAWKINDTVYAVERTRSVTSTGASYRDTLIVGGTSSALPAGSKTSMDGTSYTWVLPRTAIDGLKKPRQVLKAFSVTSSAFNSSVDAAGSNLTYADLYPSCLKPA